MGRPSRHEIEKFANGRFGIAREGILAEYEKKRDQVLREVRRKGNIGGYVPALITWGAERIRRELLALADAYVDQFTRYDMPSDRRAEKDLQTVAQQIAAGTISGIRGRLDLMARRTRMPLNEPAGHLNREIEAAMKSALNEGLLNLRQLIKSKDSEGPEQPKDDSSPPQPIREEKRGRSQTPSHKNTHDGETRPGGGRGSREERSVPRLQDPGFWRALRKEFDDLATRQRSMLVQPTHPKWLKAYCDFSKEHGEFGRCRRRGGLDGRLISEFEDVATRAALMLGCPPDIEPVGFWLYCLGQDLFKAPEPEVRAEFSPGGEWGGHVQGLLESCAGFCLRLATQAERIAEHRGADPPNSAKPLVRRYLEDARSKVRAVVEALTSGSQKLDQAAAALELEAKIWGQNLHHAILDEAALEGLPPEQFEKRAVDSALEIVGMAADEFSVACGRDTTNGATPLLIGRFPAVITSEQPPRVDTRGSIVEYLKKALADYPPEYRRQNLSVYRLTRGAEPVDLDEDTHPNGSEVLDPEQRKAERGRRLIAAQERWRTIAKQTVPFAWIHKAAGVDHKDAYNWKNGKLPDTSSMAKSIERVLNEPKPPAAPITE